MKLHNLLMASHLATAVGSGLVIGIVSQYASGPPTWFVAATVVSLGGLCAGFALSSKLQGGVSILDRVLSANDVHSIQSTGIEELDRFGDRLVALMHRWLEAAGNSREQSREVEQLIQRLDRRSGRAAVARGQGWGLVLRQQLGDIAIAATTELNQILACAKDLERHTREIALGAQDQSDVVSKTTTYVEQMSGNIDSVAHNAGAAQQAAVSTRDSASAALKLVRELVGGMNRIRTHVEASESRLRSLGDHSQEIGSIVEMIGAISSRTDMLALNASIESVRAGEHGRGFAVVAEEVRKLAEQAAQATREVAGLIESIQLETQESIALMAEEREEVEAEVSRVNSAGDALERISQISSDSAAQVAEITQATQLQLQLTQDVVLAVERISDVARASRKRAEEAIWATKTLGKLAQQFDGSLRPLRECGPAGEELVPPQTAFESNRRPLPLEDPRSIEPLAAALPTA